MSVFADYEREVVQFLVAPHLPATAVASILDAAEPVSYDHTGVGYFLTVRHPAVPDERLVCSEPLLNGSFGEGECGFVCFLEGGQLTLECYSWAGSIPQDIRSRPVRIQPAV